MRGGFRNPIRCVRRWAVICASFPECWWKSTASPTYLYARPKARRKDAAMAGAVAPANRAAKSEPQLVRGLTLTHTIALVVGTVIGTGVFLKAAIMAQAVGSPFLVLAAWLVAGLMSLTGALAYAELGALLPHAGGEYVYLR